MTLDLGFTDLKYIPAHYRPSLLNGGTLWSCGPDEPLFELLNESIRSVERLLEYRMSRRLHVVVYASNEDACRALDRRVPATQLLSPLHTAQVALVALQSSRADPRNADPRRMRRHLCHEIAHAFSAERTASLKVLGDGDQNIRLPAWVNEGFAESVVARAAQRPAGTLRMP